MRPTQRPATRLDGVMATLVAVAAAVVIAGCSSADQSPVAPGIAQRDLSAQLSAQSATNGCMSPATVVKEIASLYPNTKPMYLATKATVLYAAEVIAIGPIKGFKPDTTGAQKVAIALVDTTLKLFHATKLTGGTSAATAQLAVTVLDAYLCAAALPQSLTIASLGSGSTGAAQVVQPTAPTTTVATGDMNAGVQIPAGNLKVATLVTITPLPSAPVCTPFSGPLCTPLAQFPPYYQYTFTPSVDSTVTPNPFTYEICATTTNINVPLSQIFLAHNVTTAGVTRAQVLPKPAITLGLECDAPIIGSAASKTGAFELASRGDFKGAASELASSAVALFVTDAYAGSGTRITSVGGTAHSASPFGLVDVNDIIPYQNGLWSYHAPSFPAGTAPAPGTGDITDPTYGSTAFVPLASNGWVFNTSPFGSSPFGSGTAIDFNSSGCGSGLAGQPNVNLVWPSFYPIPASTGNLNTDSSSIFLLQQTFYIPTDWPSGTNVQIGVAIDNDIQIFLNGTDVTSMGVVGPGVSASYDGSKFLIHDGCATADSYVITLPGTVFNTGNTANVLAIRARDRGAESYVDVRLSTTVPFVPPVPSP
jgi:hypothetical protein